MSNNNRKTARNLENSPYNGQTTKIENKEKKGNPIRYIIGGLVGVVCLLSLHDCNCLGCSGESEIDNGKENDLDVSGDDAELLEDMEDVAQKLANDLVNKITEPTIDTVKEIVKETNLKIASTLVEDANDWKEQLENQETEPEIIDGETDLEDSKEDDNQKENSNNSNSNKPSSNTRPSGGSSNDATIESPEMGETTPTPPPATPTPTPPPATPTPPPATPTPTPPPATPTPPPDKIDGSTTDGDGQTDIGEGETDEIVFPSDPTDNMGEQQNSSSMPNDAEPTQDEIVSPMGTPKVSSGDANDISSRKNILMEMKMFCQRISMYQSSLEDSMVESIGTVKQYYL